MTTQTAPSNLARADLQLPLLSVQPRWKLSNVAQSRNAYGSLAQEIVCAALDLSPIRINGCCSVCFDAERDNCFYEIKSVHRTGKVVIYDWRMKKEKAARVPLKYAILIHNVRGSDGHDLFEEMISSGLQLLVLDAAFIHELALSFPLKTIQKTYLDPRNGYTRHGYKDGYRNLPVSVIKSHFPASRDLNCRMYGREFEIVRWQ